MASDSTDSKQEAVSENTVQVAGAHVIVCFDRQEAETNFSSVLNRRGIRKVRLVIAVVKDDGYFEGKIKA